MGMDGRMGRIGRAAAEGARVGAGRSPFVFSAHSLSSLPISGTKSRKSLLSRVFRWGIRKEAIAGPAPPAATLPPPPPKTTTATPRWRASSSPSFENIGRALPISHLNLRRRPSLVSSLVPLRADPHVRARWQPAPADRTFRFCSLSHRLPRSSPRASDPPVSARVLGVRAVCPRFSVLYYRARAESSSS